MFARHANILSENFVHNLPHYIQLCFPNEGNIEGTAAGQLYVVKKVTWPHFSGYVSGKHGIIVGRHDGVLHCQW